MAQPPSYDPAADFSEEDTNVGAQLDIEFNAIKATLDVVLTNLALLQRDDTALLNDSVHPESIAQETLTLLALTWNPRGAWVTATVYALGDTVTNGGLTYLCSEAHTSGTFSTDLAANKWMPVGGYVTETVAQTDLTDGVSDYSGLGGRYMKVNDAETGLETGYDMAVMTSAAYTALGTKDSNTIYFVTA